MRGPQSAPSDFSTFSKPKRRFTLDQANRSLPLVRRIVADIVRVHDEAIELQDRLARLPSREQPAIQAELDRRLEQLEDFVDELTEIGCELKDYRLGLIDFTGRHEGRDVYLCWKLGEEKVGFWHELDAGAAGRQSVATLRE